MDTTPELDHTQSQTPACDLLSAAEAVRYMRTRDGIPPFPRLAPIEQQIPRMTTSRLREIAALVAAEIARRENKENPDA